MPALHASCYRMRMPDLPRHPLRHSTFRIRHSTFSFYQFIYFSPSGIKKQKACSIRRDAGAPAYLSAFSCVIGCSLAHERLLRKWRAKVDAASTFHFRDIRNCSFTKELFLLTHRFCLQDRGGTAACALCRLSCREESADVRIISIGCEE
jgi:hypothetical protein